MSKDLYKEKRSKSLNNCVPKNTIQDFKRLVDTNKWERVTMKSSTYKRRV